MKTNNHIAIRNLYSIHDKGGKAIALILANDLSEAEAIWQDGRNHELVFFSKGFIREVVIKELIHNFQINKIDSLLSEKSMKPGKSLLCTKLARYYIY